MAASPTQDQILDQDKQKGYVCNVGSYCSSQMKTPTVPGSNGGIYHRTTTTITDGKATTDVFVFRQGTILGGLPTGQGEWVKAGTTTDGGKTYTFNDAKDSNGNPIIGAGVRQSLAPNGDMNKNVKAQITRTLTGNNLQETAATPKLTNEQIKQTGAVDSNTATSEGTVGPESFNADIIKSINEGITGLRPRKDYGNNRYPLNMKANQDHIKFTMYEYVPKAFESGTGLGGFDRKNKNIGTMLGVVTLPIQPQISDSNSVTWGEDSINALQAAFAAASYAAIVQGVDGGTRSLDDIGKTVADQKNNISASFAAKFAGKAVGANENFLSRTTGAILNNNVELLFQGPALRSFSFTFLMSAREKDETEMIRKIIRFFKEGMSVKRTTGNLFLKAPNVFTIEYFHNDSAHKYINKIKTCALQNCSVNYTPDGNYATYEDGSMTQYSLTLTFGEIDPIYDDDYSQDDDGTIGY
jgi:hypothetical protein